MKFIQHIEVGQEKFEGKPFISGTQIKVSDIVNWHEQLNLSPVEIISRHSNLTVAQIYAALSFYHDNKQDLDLDIDKTAQSGARKEATIFFDGGSRGNPGPAAGAAVLVFPDRTPEVVSRFFEEETNNVAEYTGLILGLEKALQLGIKDLKVYGDSNLVVKQVTGEWKVKTAHLRPLCNRVKQLSKDFDSISINWVKRNENKLADSAVNNCLDQYC